MASNGATPIPITLITGFLGSGKTTLLLNLVPQLPKSYKLALLKNEFGDLAIDSQLASAQSISGVQELLNGCICCNLVGQLGDALETLLQTYAPDRIIIETSGAAFPMTMALEINRLARDSAGPLGKPKWNLDGVISVIDCENWEGYDDTGVTAKMQAQYTDLIVFNKWESVSERRFDECLDRLGDLDVQTAWVKSNRGVVAKNIILGIDGALAQELDAEPGKVNAHVHDNKTRHHEEVEVLSITLDSPEEHTTASVGVDLEKLQDFLLSAPKDEIYRIKAVLYANSPPTSSNGENATGINRVEGPEGSAQPARYILNWAFGRWTFTQVDLASNPPDGTSNGDRYSQLDNGHQEPVVRMTVISARYESGKWKKRIEEGSLLALDVPDMMESARLLKVMHVS